jgi:hypothetical protein
MQHLFPLPVRNASRVCVNVLMMIGIDPDRPAPVQDA